MVQLNHCYNNPAIYCQNLIDRHFTRVLVGFVCVALTPLNISKSAKFKNRTRPRLTYQFQTHFIYSHTAIHNFIITVASCRNNDITKLQIQLHFKP